MKIEIEQVVANRYDAKTDSMKPTRAYRVWVNGEADVRYFTSRRAAKQYAHTCRKSGKLV